MSSHNTIVLQFETDTWKRLLGFLMDENNRLKIRLSEILNHSTDKSLLTRAELFQNSFIREDELIQLLRNEIAEINSLLQQESQEENPSLEAGNRIQKLRKSILHTENEFYKLMLSFNTFLSERLTAKQVT